MNIINFKNGNFQITDQLIISKETSYNDLLKLVPENKIWDVKNGYKWIYFEDTEIDELFFNIGICFYNEVLFSINFSFNDKQMKNSFWDNWNETAELKRKDIYEKWLTKLAGNKRDFDWGTAGAYFDPRSGAASVYLTYN